MQTDWETSVSLAWGGVGLGAPIDFEFIMFTEAICADSVFWWLGSSSGFQSECMCVPCGGGGRAKATNYLFKYHSHYSYIHYTYIWHMNIHIISNHYVNKCKQCKSYPFILLPAWDHGLLPPRASSSRGLWWHEGHHTGAAHSCHSSSKQLHTGFGVQWAREDRRSVDPVISCNIG